MTKFYNIFQFSFKFSPEERDWLRGTAAALTWISLQGEDVAGQVPDPLTLTDPEPRMLELAPDQWEVACQLFAEYSSDAGVWIEPDIDLGAEVLLITADASAHVEVLSGLIQATLIRWKIEGAIRFEWALLSSSPLPHEFTGGAAVITRQAIAFVGTNLWLPGKQERLRTANTGSVP
jgi:hypothetical protein